MKTTYTRSTDVEERWYVFDASQFLLGRMAADIARKLQGKDRPTYQPNEATGAHVVVLNAGRIRVSGRKDEQKQYQRYSGYPGGRHIRSIDEMREQNPRDMIKLAVRRMLPKTRLGKTMLSRLKVYAGTDHPHTAQKPETVTKLSK